ncbi:male-enhanced antigen 1 [Leptopilina boulardi]|uniref:male-enhanced antigen 1 n=1 Tax=Leptopilina boulardi TaxID=63433 RepID=UPI0021F570E4|nr:male-enhanced antigen 1 [Leptopilina boulardi]XP_051174849.1 male-enhanced antigen 1 [Leptopilina boulardi]
MLMSPEPKHDTVDENWSSSNVAGVGVQSDSESEDEDHTIEGYVPLAQDPIDGDLLLEDEEEEWASSPLNLPEVLPESTSSQTHIIQSETVQVWSSSCNFSNIDMDADKINQVKHVMASFSLPNTAIPEWANTVSEEQWKEQLMDRIKTMQRNNL